MTNATAENFIAALTEFAWPNPVQPSYRLYYNDDGSPKCYSMEHQEGKYIDVDAETFALRPWNVKIVAGQLQFIATVAQVQKLKPNQPTGTPCHTQDVCVVVEQHQPHTLWKNTSTDL